MVGQALNFAACCLLLCWSGAALVLSTNLADYGQHALHLRYRLKHHPQALWQAHCPPPRPAAEEERSAAVAASSAAWLPRLACRQRLLWRQEGSWQPLCQQGRLPRFPPRHYRLEVSCQLVWWGRRVTVFSRPYHLFS